MHHQDLRIAVAAEGDHDEKTARDGIGVSAPAPRARARLRETSPRLSEDVLASTGARAKTLSPSTAELLVVLDRAFAEVDTWSAVPVQGR